MEYVNLEDSFRYAYLPRISCAARDRQSVIALLEPVGDTGTKDPVDPALEDGRWLTPPVRMDDDDAIG